MLNLTHGLSANLLKHFDTSLIHCVCLLVYYWLRMHILICYFASIILQQWAERPGQQGGVDVGHRHCRVSLTFDCCVLFLSGRSFSLGEARLQRQRKRQRCTPHTCLGNKRDRSPLHGCRSQNVIENYTSCSCAWLCRFSLLLEGLAWFVLYNNGNEIMLLLVAT